MSNFRYDEICPACGERASMIVRYCSGTELYVHDHKEDGYKVSVSHGCMVSKDGLYKNKINKQEA